MAQNKEFSAEQYGDIIRHAAKNRLSILDLSKNLDQSVVETSRLLNSICKEDEKYLDICDKLNWPVNITAGHIYIGGAPETSNGTVCMPERNETIKVGDYVLTGDHIKKNYLELWEAVSTWEKLVVIENYKGELIPYWFSQSDVNEGKLHKLCKQHHTEEFYITEHVRINYRRGNWLGVVNRRWVVSVHSK